METELGTLPLVNKEEHPVSSDEITIKIEEEGKEQIKLNLRTITGRTFSVFFSSQQINNNSTTVLDLKTKVEQVHTIPASFQRLIFGGRELQDTTTLKECFIIHDSVIHLLLRQNIIPSAIPGELNNNNNNNNIPVEVSPFTHEQERNFHRIVNMVRFLKINCLMDFILLLVWIDSDYKITYFYFLGLILIPLARGGLVYLSKPFISFYVIYHLLSIVICGIIISYGVREQTVFRVIVIFGNMLILKFLYEFFKLFHSITPEEKTHLVQLIQTNRR